MEISEITMGYTVHRFKLSLFVENVLLVVANLFFGLTRLANNVNLRLNLLNFTSCTILEYYIVYKDKYQWFYL